MGANFENILKTRFDKIKSRCTNMDDPSYSKYGAKGISLCKEWAKNEKKFINWALTNGFNSTDKKIYRKDIKKGYSPENCLIMNNGEYFSYMAKVKDEKMNLSNQEDSIKRVKYNDIIFTVFIIDNIAYLTRKEITQKLYNSCDKNSKAKILYYQKKALRQHADMRIKDYSYNGTTMTMYNLETLKLMKDSFTFHDEQQLKKYDNILTFLTKYDLYLQRIKNLKDTENAEEKKKNIEKELSIEDLKIHYVDELMKLCDSKQKILLTALKTLFTFEKKQKEVINKQGVPQQTYTQMKW